MCSVLTDCSFFIDLYTFFSLSHHLHFQCAVAYLIAPHIFDTVHTRCDVELCSPLSRGQTVIDITDLRKKPKNIHVCRAMQVDQFFDLLLAALQRANAVSPLNSIPDSASLSETDQASLSSSSSSCSCSSFASSSSSSLTAANEGEVEFHDR